MLSYFSNGLVSFAASATLAQTSMPDASWVEKGGTIGVLCVVLWFLLTKVEKRLEAIDRTLNAILLTLASKGVIVEVPKDQETKP